MLLMGVMTMIAAVEHQTDAQHTYHHFYHQFYSLSSSWVTKPVSFLFCAIDIHLALCTVEFQSESSAITQLQEQRLLPLRLLASSFNTITQRVADAMAALHDEGFSLRLLNLKCRFNMLHAMRLVEMLSTAICDIIEIWPFAIGWLPDKLLRTQFMLTHLIQAIR